MVLIVAVDPTGVSEAPETVIVFGGNTAWKPTKSPKLSLMFVPVAAWNPLPWLAFGYIVTPPTPILERASSAACTVASVPVTGIADVVWPKTVIVKVAVESNAYPFGAAIVKIIV